MENSTSDHQEASESLPRIIRLIQRPHLSLHRDLTAAVRPPQERKVRTSTMESGTGACLLTAQVVPAIQEPVLKLPELMKPFILRTDASGVGVATVLLQENEVKLCQVDNATKKLGPAKAKYPSYIEKGRLAVVWGFRRFKLNLAARD